jgi:hypothetical protein
MFAGKQLSNNMLVPSRRNYVKVLNSMSKQVLEANYAVRGAIPIRGAEIQKDLTTGKSANYNFTETVSLNIGNP